MRPSVRAEKYIRDASGAEKTLPMAPITGRTDRRTDRQTDRQSATQYAAPPREEGRIIIIRPTVYRGVSAITPNDTVPLPVN